MFIILYYKNIASALNTQYNGKFQTIMLGVGIIYFLIKSLTSKMSIIKLTGLTDIAVFMILIFGEIVHQYNSILAQHHNILNIYANAHFI